MAQRKVATATLQEDCGAEEAQLYNPPPDMVSMALVKMHWEAARGLMVVSACESAPWMGWLRG